MMPRFPLRSLAALSLGLISAAAPVARASATYEVLNQFPLPVTHTPGAGWTKLFLTADGKIYGGGVSNHLGLFQPTIYQVLPQGGVENVHVIDTLPNPSSRQSIGSLLPTAGGGYVGSTRSLDGLSGSTVFSLSPGTLACTVLASFPATSSFQAAECLVAAADGSFYGCSTTGGTDDNGTLFRITAQGQFVTLMNFPASASHPQRLCFDQSGVLCGITANDEDGLHAGTLFRYTEGAGINVICTFPAATSSLIDVAPRLTTGGFMVGTEHELFQVTAAGVATLVAGDDCYVLCSAPDGSVYDTSDNSTTIHRTAPDGQRTLVTGNTSTSLFTSVLPDGKIYSLTSYATVERITPATGVVEHLADFMPTPDNVGLTGAVAATADGSIYGLAQYGGDQFKSTLFRRTSAGVTSTFATFPAGVYGVTGPVPGPDGNFYGLSMESGPSKTSIYKVTSAGTASLLVSPDGLTNTYLTLGGDGYLYTWVHVTGETSYRVLQVSLTGVVLQIATVPDSEGSLLSMVTGTDGKIYGLVTNNTSGGTIYRFTPGQLPVAVGNLTQAGYGTVFNIFPGADGKLYGIAFADATRTTTVVFRLTPGQAPVVVRSFPYTPGVIDRPSRLTIAADGTIYGLQGGGYAGFGQAFRLGTDGSYSVLHQFEPNTGANPSALTLAPDGVLYGVAGDTDPLQPAAGGGGTVFRLKVTGQPASPYELWLGAHRLTLADSNGDPDHDGRTNLAEFIFGTDPLVADFPVPAGQGRSVVSVGAPVVQPGSASSDGKPHMIVAIRKNLDASGIGYLTRDFRSGSVPASPQVLAEDSDFLILSYPFPDGSPQFLQVIMGGP